MEELLIHQQLPSRLRDQKVKRGVMETNGPKKTKAIDFDLEIRALAGEAHVGRMSRLLKQARGMIRGELREVSIAIVGDRKMARLHEGFMGIAGPTDVLTFELQHDNRGRVTAGEVVVNAQEAARQARAHGVQLEDELLLYALHGLLHLSGYNDTTKSAYTKMHRTEDRILTKLGVGRVFARRSVSRPRRKQAKGRRA